MLNHANQVITLESDHQVAQLVLLATIVNFQMLNHYNAQLEPIKIKQDNKFAKSVRERITLTRLDKKLALVLLMVSSMTSEVIPTQIDVYMVNTVTQLLETMMNYLFVSTTQ